MTDRLGLTAAQTQKMTLAPQLRQGLKMLAMPLPELRSELIREMSRNPLIEDVEPTLEKTTISQMESRCADAEPERDYPEDDNAIDAARLEGFSRPDDYRIGGAYDGRTVADAETIERRQRFFENQVREETLEQHLVAQLPYSGIDEADYPLAEMLIGDLNDDGMFVGSMADIVMVSGETEAKVRAVLAKIRDLDPPGCGATSARECLEAQLDKIADARLRRKVARLIASGLEAVAAGKAGDEETLRALRALDPRPGRAYRRDVRSTEYVNPEVTAVRCTGGWLATVDARSLPEIRISKKYTAMLDDPSVSRETKSYIRERMAAANQLVEAVRERGETIERIAQEIFDRQPGFFEKGLKGLVPMTEQSVADKLGLHHSTVSRTVNGKYVATPRGVVELRRFFSQGVTTDSGETVTRDGVLDRIREIVGAEDRSRPLSDERISEMLKGDGFHVARRTVAKYRGLAGIPGASERRG